MKINPNLKTPYYLIDESLLQKNLEIIKNIKDRSGCKILLAQKAFSMYSLYPLMSKYLEKVKTNYSFYVIIPQN